MTTQQIMSSSLQVIPDELLRNTFEFINFKEKHKLLSVCSQWKSIVTVLATKQHLEMYHSINGTMEKKYFQHIDSYYKEFSDEGDTIDILRYDVDSKFNLEHLVNSRKDTSNFSEVTNGKYDLNCALPDILIETYVKLKFPFDDKRFEVTDVDFPVKERAVYRELIQSINSLKSTVYLRINNNGVISINSQVSHEFYFIMNNKEAWYFNSEKSTKKETYSC
jgi:hypothetical protein